MEQFWRDVLFAGRRLRAAPLFTVFSVVTLALGIGVTTAAYSLLYDVVWSDVGVRDPDGVVAIYQRKGVRGQPFSGPEARDIADQQTVFSGVAPWSVFVSALSANGKPELVQGEAVGGNFFQVIGVAAALGRTIQPGDDRPDAPAVMVLSDLTWRTQFGRDPHVVGTTVRMAGRVFEIVGVVPSTFHGISGGGGVSLAAWVPLSSSPGRGRNLRIDLTTRERHSLSMIARLKPGRSVVNTTSELGLIGQRLDAIAPLGTGPGDARTVAAWPAFPSRGLLAQKSQTLIILSIPALVLLVACTNLANLVLSRGASRRHEFAVRTALGASRWQLVRSQLVEGAMTAALGGLGGLLVTRGLLAYVNASIEDAFGSSPLFHMDTHIQPAVFVAAGGAALLALLVSALAPAWHLTRRPVRNALATDTGAGAAPRWRGRSNVIALQVSVSVALFLVTALGVTLLATDAHDDRRVGLERVAMVSVPFSLQQRDEQRVREMIGRVLDEVRAAPGVESVAVSSMPGSQITRGSVGGVTAPDIPFVRGYDGEFVSWIVATPGIFRTLGLPIRFGRAFDDRDESGAMRVAVVNESLARKVFRTADATGRDLLVRLRIDRASDYSQPPAVMTIRIVGITADTYNAQGKVDHEVRVPFAQSYDPDVAILARGAAGGVSSLAGTIRTAVRRADPDVAITFAGRADLALRWLPGVAMGMVTTAAGSLATLALVLAMAGLYGVLSHVVLRRTRELGLRMALGADRRAIVRLILKDGLRPVVEGLIIGLAGAAVIRMALQATLTETVTAFDFLAFGIAAGPLGIAAAIACYLPARRAAGVDPNVALRQQ